MKLKYALLLLFGLLLGILSFAITPKAHADKQAGESATLSSSKSVTAEDPRIVKLRKYLEKRNSPLAVHSGDFVREADLNRLDWRFLAAISGAESSFGLRIPANSYNGWGWGVYGNNVKRFNSWDEAIATISGEIRSKYMNKWGAKDVYGIGRRYAASPTWATKVQYFMDQIENFEEEPKLATLPISL